MCSRMHTGMNAHATGAIPTDLYAAGERSGKHAKPDAVSAAANERTCAAVPALAPPSTGMHSAICMSPSATVAGSAVHFFTRVDQFMVGLLTYLPSGAMPRLAFLPFPTALPGYTFVPPSTAVPGLTHAGKSAQTMFWGEIMPRNVLAHAHFSPGPTLT